MQFLKPIAPIVVLVCITLACGRVQRSARPALPPTRTPLPTFTSTSVPTLPPTVTPMPVLTDTPTLVPATYTPIPTLTLVPTDTSVPSTATPTAVLPSPTDTPLPPPPTAIPTDTPTPEPIIKFVLAGAQREFNCESTYIYGTVKDANNSGVPGVEVRALGIHETSGLEFVTRTDAEGRFELFRFPLPDLLSGQWAVMVMEDGREISERFHWASTPVCESDDLGHSQVLRLDWKLVQ